MANSTSHRNAWKDPLRRDLAIVALLVGWLPVYAVLLFTLNEAAAIPLLVLYQACLVAAVIYKMLFRCPRCGKFFYIGYSTYQNPFISQVPALQPAQRRVTVLIAPASSAAASYLALAAEGETAAEVVLGVGLGGGIRLRLRR